MRKKHRAPQMHNNEQKVSGRMSNTFLLVSFTFFYFINFVCVMPNVCINNQQNSLYFGT